MSLTSTSADYIASTIADVLRAEFIHEGRKLNVLKKIPTQG